jgi:OOP family OmpA-OmpF porin
MRSKNILQIIGAALLSFTTLNALAEARFYDPSNVASPTGKTIGYELFRTIGCPGKQLLDAPCAIPDSDGDGVTDDKDKCPNTPKGRKVDANGCELDSDGDGVVDGLDKCPNTPPGRVVNAEGCELDSDGDGLVDGVDRCPAVYAKTADGCPLPPPPPPAPEPRKLILEGVNFDNDKSTLRPDAIGILERAAIALKEWGSVKVEIAGHTDSVSTDAYNQALSERRASAVRDFLISRGIAADRLSAKGYGESTPIADNGTDEGRASNRRVEMIPQP